MRVVRWLLGMGLVVFAFGVVALWAARDSLTAWGTRRVEAVLADVFEVPAHIGAIELSLLPPRIRIHDARIGADRPTLAVREVDVTLRIGESLRTGRPVASLTATGVFFDADRLPKSKKKSHPPGPAALPRVVPFLVVADRIEDVTVQFPVGGKGATATAKTPLVTGRVSMDVARPYVSFVVDCAAAVVERAAHHLNVARVHLDAGVEDDQFFVHEWTVEGDHLHLRAVNESPPPDTRHHITAELPFDVLGVVFEPLQEVAGATRADASLRGELFDPLVEADVRLDQATVHGLAVGDLHGTFTRNGRELTLADAEITAWGGSARASFALTVGGTVPATGQVAWHDLAATQIGHLGEPPRDWSALSQGSAQISGTLDPLALTVASEGTLVPHIERSESLPARWTADLVIAKDELRLSGTIKQGAENQAHLALTLAHGETVSGTAEVKLGDVAKLASLTPPPLRDGLSGSLAANASVSGPMTRPTFAGTLDGDRLTIFGATIPKIRGQLEWSGSELTARGVQITTASGSGEINGTFGLMVDAANDWRLSARNLDVTPLTAAADFLGWSLPLQGGVLDGSASCRGPWSAPQIEAELELHRLWLLREPVHTLAIKAHVSPQGWNGELRLDHTKTESVTLSAAGLGTRQLRATLASTGLRLSQLRGAGWRGLDGTVTLYATIDGALERPSGSVRVEGHDLMVDDHLVGDGLITAEGKVGDWTAHVTLLGEALQAEANWRVGADWPFTLRGELRPTDLAALLLLKSLMHIEVAGTFDVHGRLAALSDVSGEVRISDLKVSRQSYAVQASEPIVLQGEHGRFRVLRCAIGGGGSHLDASGTFATSGALDVDVTGNGDLELVELLIDPVQSARGTFALHAKIRRSEAGVVTLSGAASVSDAAIDAGLPVACTDTSGEFSLAGDRIVIDALAGKLGGGTFEVGGVASVSTGPEMSWTIREVALPVSDGLEARVSGEGKVAGPWESLVVSGNVEVLDALYDRDVGLADLLPVLQRLFAAAPQREATATGVGLDLRVFAHDGVFVDNNVAAVELWLDLQVAGHATKPVLLGTIGVFGGEVKFRNRTFTVTGGAIEFRDRFDLNPVLNLSAESDITTSESEYTVRATVSGKADNPRVEFTADDPSLSQNDVLSLVAFGKTSAQLQREAGGVGAGSAMAFIPTGMVEAEVRRLVGVDRFEVEATQARTTGTIEPRLTVGKDLTDRLRVLASTTVGTGTAHGVQLEYKLTRRISLLASWESETQDEAGAFGGDVKFRYEFRRFPLSLFPSDDCVKLDVR